MRLGDIVWSPSPEAWTQSSIGRYLQELRTERGLDFRSYDDLHRWSVAHPSDFWHSVWQFYDVRSHTSYEPGLPSPRMPGARWFTGASLNYAEHALRTTGSAVAVIEHSQTRDRNTLTWDELRAYVARVRSALSAAGVGPGDRVATYCPTIHEALVIYLASTSLGAIYSSCPIEFGVQGVVSRLGQIRPKVLFGVDGYRYRSRTISRGDELAEIARALPDIEQLVVIPYLTAEPQIPEGAVRWDDFLTGPQQPLQFTPVAFDHPLVIVYSSGTTGPPKPIVHGHGGVLLEHLKSLGLQLGLGPQDRFFWHTTTGWMMWNYLVSGLAVGCSVVLFDGDPGHPDQLALWRMAAAERITVFGISPRFLLINERAGVRPAELDLSALVTVGSTGSPLGAEAYDWFAREVGRDIALVSASGGTDILSGLACGAPIVPVYAGEISCAALGVDLDVIDSNGDSVVGEPGELVVRAPMPSMPVAFWNDPDGTRLRESYFAANPGLWTHGDWAVATTRGSFVVSGRSDATLNRGGVRIGTAELYSAIEQHPLVDDSLAICVEGATNDDDDLLVVFVSLTGDHVLDDGLEAELKREVGRALSPRHVPDRIVAIDTVPRTTSGKKAEVPVKRILQGLTPTTQANEAVVIGEATLLLLHKTAAELR